jgi:hypothetical protein
VLHVLDNGKILVAEGMDVAKVIFIPVGVLPYEVLEGRQLVVVLFVVAAQLRIGITKHTRQCK